MHIVVAVVVGLALGMLRGGRLGHMGHASFRLWPLLAVGIAAQAASAVAPASANALVLASYGMMLVFAAANFRHPGMGVVCVGIALNAVVIGANGAMPVRADALVAAGIVDSGEAAGALDFGTKRHLETPDDRLGWLGDIIPVPWARDVLSFGDLVLAVGVAAVLVHLLTASPPHRTIPHKPPK